MPNSKAVLKYFLSWLPGMPIAIINGSLRQFVYGPYVGELIAHQLSVISFVLLFGLYVWFILPWLKFTKTAQYLYLGSSWFVFTVIFEFIFGHYVMGHSWEKLFYDYNLFAGRLWVLVLIWILISPWLIYLLKRKSA